MSSVWSVRPTGVHSLQEEGRQRHTDDQQVQEIEGVSTEGAAVQESSVDRHLDTREEEEQRLHTRLMLNVFVFVSVAVPPVTFRTISTVKTDVNT